MHFEVAVGEYLPYLRLKVFRNEVQMSGPLAEAFHFLSVRLNFTYTLHKVKGNSWGMHGPEGWTGMLGMIERNEVDMAVGPFTLTYDRWKSFKLSDPVYVDNVEILAPASEWKMTLFSVVSVFSLAVWIAVFIALLSVTLAVTVIERNKEGYTSFFFRFSGNLWLSFMTLLQKGRKRQPDNYLQSTLYVVWLYSTFVISTVFGGILLTKLFIRRVQRIDSLDDLVASPSVQPILEYHSSLFSIFKNSEAKSFSTIFQRVTSNPDKGIQTYGNMSTTGMDLVFSGSAAMITDGMGLKGFMVQRLKDGHPCSFWLAKEAVLTMWKVLAFSQKFPDEWFLKINEHLRHTLGSGWLQARMQREFAKYGECLSQGGNDVVSLGFEHTRGVFLIWLLGCGASFVVLFLECFKVYGTDIFNYRNKNIGNQGRSRTKNSYNDQVNLVNMNRRNVHNKQRAWR